MIHKVNSNQYYCSDCERSIAIYSLSKTIISPSASIPAYGPKKTPILNAHKQIVIKATKLQTLTFPDFLLQKSFTNHHNMDTTIYIYVRTFQYRSVVQRLCWISKHMCSPEMIYKILKKKIKWSSSVYNGFKFKAKWSVC